MIASHDGDLETLYPAMAVGKFRGESKGLKGTGTFSFEVLDGEKGGQVLLRLSEMAFKTENKADQSYKEMVGVNGDPAARDDGDEDDGTDIV